MPHETTIQTPDGTPLVLRTWPAAAPARGAALFVHGLGEHIRRYDHVAAVLNAMGIEVRGYDQRGFGRSGGPRATLPASNTLVEDAAFVFARFAAERRARGDATTPFILGHSMGGCVVARAVTSGRIAPAGMVLSSPALLLRMFAVQRAAIRLAGRLVPNLRVPHMLPMHLVSHDADVVRAIDTDPDAHDRATPRLVAFMVDAGRAAIEDAARCHVPTLLLIAGDDHFVDPEGSRRFAARLPAGVGTLIEYDGLYHEVFNERPPDRARVLDDLAAWFRTQLESAAQRPVDA